MCIVHYASLGFQHFDDTTLRVLKVTKFYKCHRLRFCSEVIQVTTMFFFHVKIGVLLFSVVFLFVKLLNNIICFNFLWIYKPPSLEPVRCKNRKKVLTKKLVWEQGTSEDSE